MSHYSFFLTLKGQNVHHHSCLHDTKRETGGPGFLPASHPRVGTRSIDFLFTSLNGYSVCQRVVFFRQAIHYHFISAADICHAVPQSATFPATSVSPAGKALCPGLSATPRAAASTNSPLPATTPWMVSCILCSPLAFSGLFT